MNTPTFVSRVARARKWWAIAFSVVTLSLALPNDAYAQPKGGDNPGAGDGKGSDNPGKGKGPGDHGTAPVPEPATWATLATFAIIAGVLARRQFKKRQETSTN